MTRVTRPRLVLAIVLLLLTWSAPGHAASRELMPGVRYEKITRATLHGPLVVHVLTAPRPGGLYQLTPVLSNGTVLGRETVSSMERRLSGQATMAGVNGDLFEWASGRPSGMLMLDGQLIHAPSATRSSTGITSDGTLDVRRLVWAATWQGPAAVKRRLDHLNRAPGENGISLFTSAWGPTTPALPGAMAVTLFPLPLTAPNTDLAAPVVDARRTSAAVPIPPGAGVLVARGVAASALELEATPGSQLVLSLAITSLWENALAAIGGGPVLVRDGQPVFNALEDFLPSQLSPRNPRTAVGQTAAGRLLFVVADGRSPTTSVGVSNWELAQLMKSLGAVTATALDAGGSSTMAFDGRVLNDPSDPGGERPVSEGLMVAYTGVFAQPVTAATSGPVPFGVQDAVPSFRYKVVRPSTVTTTLKAPGGVVAATETAERAAGTYDVALGADGLAPTAVSPVAATPIASGKWTLTVDATDDLAQQSRMTSTVTVNRTVTNVAARPRTVVSRPPGRKASLLWQQTESARIVVTIERLDGTRVRTLAERRFAPGPVAITWNGLDRRGGRLRAGSYVVRIAAANRLGVLDVRRRFTVR